MLNRSPLLGVFRQIAAPMRSLRRFLVAALTLTGVIACGSATVGGGYNPTTPTNVFEERLFDHLDSNVVVIASVNLGGPSRNYLKKRESFVDARVQEYLEDAGYEVRALREFSQRWNNAVLIYGDPVDPTTGRVNQKSFIQIVQAVRDQLREQTDIGSIVFTDIIEKDVYYEQGLNRVTRFDGVARKPAVQGAGSGVTAEFDWSRPVAAATMRIAWFNMDLERIFSGEGGMDVTDAVDTRSGTAFVRRRDVLENENYTDEGIAIAFHPIIAMKKWPGNP